MKRGNTFFLFLITCGIILRLMFMMSTGFTNDEGAYLYDAKWIASGQLTKGDALTKTPISVFIFGLSVLLTKQSLYAARMVSILASILTLFPLVIICRELRLNKYVVSFVWILFAGAVTFQILGQTETLSSLFAAFMFAFFLKSLNARTKWNGWITGLFFGLAFATRKSNAILLFFLIAGLCIAAIAKEKKYKLIKDYILGFMTVIIPLSFMISVFYGWNGIKEFIGIGYGNIVIKTINGTENIWNFNFVDSLKALTRIASSFIVIYLFSLIYGISLIFQEGKRIFRNKFFLPLLWIISLTFFYAVSPIFLVDYAADFLLPLTLLAGMIFEEIKANSSRMLKVVVTIIIVLNVFNYYSLWKKPWTGMFEASAIRESARELLKTIPSKEPILTAAAIVPYYSGHHIYEDVSHPLWYRYSFVDKKTLEAYLPSKETVVNEIKSGKTKWLLLDHLTDYAYFRGKENLIDLVSKNWELVTVIENETGFRSNPLTVYKRK